MTQQGLKPMCPGLSGFGSTVVLSKQEWLK